MRLRRLVKNAVFLTHILAAVFLTGCLQEGESSSAAPSPGTGGGNDSAVVELGFNGIHAIQNLDGNSIKVSWLKATSSNVVGYRVFEVMPDGALNAIQQVDALRTSFIHSGLVLGSTHSYLVRAIDIKNNHDGNMVIKSMLTYGGISSVVSMGLNTATVYFNPASATAGANIYYRPERGGDWTLAGSVSNMASSYNVTGLKSGTTYAFRVLAFDGSGIEDSNPVVLTAQTNSYSFNPPTPLMAKYRGFVLAQAYGASPGAGAAPTTRQVTLVWVDFNTGGTIPGLPSSYSLVRVAQGGTLDMATNTPCTSTTMTSCQVCTRTGAGNQICTDTNVGAPPAIYDYAVSYMSGADWPEEVPSSASDTPYRTTVHIPPDNMVLVHRDSVNYEVCTLQGKTPDPLNKQRCAISGVSMIGAVPYNTSPNRNPLNLSSGYFDFGYNLFVDRWEAACNWTAQANGGMCEAAGAPGNCFGTGAPAGTIGTIGNVYYRTDNGQCYIKTASTTWTHADTTALTTEQRAAILTNNPKAQSGYRPPLVSINQTNSQATCSTVIDPHYGQKRLLRKREFSAAAAWATLPGEPNVLDDTKIDAFEYGGAANAHTASVGYQCNSLNHKDITAGAFTTTNLAGDAGDAVKSFNIGSLETSGCVSRFGAQDMVGNVWEWNSDQMYCNNTAAPIATPYSLGAYSCVGLPSPLDSGNGYSNGFDMNGFKFDGVQGPGGAAMTNWTIQSMGNSATSFNFALGLPLVGNDNGNAAGIAGITAKFHGDRFYLDNNNSNTLRGLYSGGSWGSSASSGRWASYWNYAPTFANSFIGFRCALPAE